MNGDQDDTTTASDGRPTEAECWKQFWEAVAILWLELPPEIQREYAEKYPRGSAKRPKRLRDQARRVMSMEYDELGDLDGVPVHVPASDDYRTCSECGRDCEPDISIGVDGESARIAFVCPQHGVQSIIDPFEDQR